MSTKFVFVTGGVVSGLGKGICAASLGRLLKQRGVRVRNQKFDPYINVDPGTMSPYQHGEVFVTEDGAETDLDLGHYERFVDEDLGGNSSVSSGKIYWSVLNRERRGDYLGATVQIIPHITDEIKRRIYAMAEEDVDVVISEIGGTVGDIESQPFLEAIRQVASERPHGDVVFIHVPLIVQIPGSGELKSKPTQHSVKELLSLGIQPDVLVCRCDAPITEDIRRKIALFCNVEPDCVIQNTTASTLYEVPLLMAREGLDEVVCRKLGLITHQPDLREWSERGPDSGGLRRCTGARRLRRPGHRGHDYRHPLCPGTPGALPGHLPGYADGRGGICPPCAGHGRRQFLGVFQHHGPSGHRPDAGSGRRDGQGRHHAAGPVSLRARGGFPEPEALWRGGNL